MKWGKVLRLRASRLNTGGECLVLLPRGFINVLLDVSSRFYWSRLWLDDDDETIELNDEQMATVNLGISRLMDCMDIINNINVECGCSGGGVAGGQEFTIVCDGSGNPIINIDPTVDIDSDWDNPIPDGYEVAIDKSEPVPQELRDTYGVSTWAEIEQIWCDMAHQAIVMRGRAMVALESLFEYSVTMAQVATFLSYVGLLETVQNAGLSAFMKLVRNITAYEGIDKVTDGLQTMGREMISGQLRQELACTAYNSVHDLSSLRTGWRADLQNWMVSNLFNQEAVDLVTPIVEVLLPMTQVVKDFYLGELFAGLPAGNDCSGCGGSGGGFTVVHDFSVNSYADEYNVQNAVYESSENAWSINSTATEGGYIALKGNAHNSSGLYQVVRIDVTVTQYPIDYGKSVNLSVNPVSTGTWVDSEITESELTAVSPDVQSFTRTFSLGEIVQFDDSGCARVQVPLISGGSGNFIDVKSVTYYFEPV